LAAKGDLEIAALAISIGVLSNTALKMMIALILGRSTFRVIAAATLAAMLAAGAAVTMFLMN
jgi:hypothetical protein